MSKTSVSVEGVVGCILLTATLLGAATGLYPSMLLDFRQWIDSIPPPRDLDRNKVWTIGGGSYLLLSYLVLGPILSRRVYRVDPYARRFPPAEMIWVLSPVSAVVILLSPLGPFLSWLIYGSKAAKR